MSTNDPAKMEPDKSEDATSNPARMEPDVFDLFKVKIDRNAHLAIDKSRGNRNTATSLFPATMRDSSLKPIEVVAKVSS